MPSPVFADALNNSELLRKLTKILPNNSPKSHGMNSTSRILTRRFLRLPELLRRIHKGFLNKDAVISRHLERKGPRLAIGRGSPSTPGPLA